MPGSKALRIAIIGAGPCGALLAHRLGYELKDRALDLHVFDAGPNPLEHDRTAANRDFAFTVSHRGLNALEQCGLLAAAMRAGQQLTHQVVCIHKGKTKKRKIPPPRVTTVPFLQQDIISLRRSDLVRLIISSTKEAKLPVQYHWHHRLIECSFTLLQATFEEHGTHKAFEYDVIVGADGTHSKVREIIRAADSSFEVQMEQNINSYKSFWLEPRNELREQLQAQGLINPSAYTLHIGKDKNTLSIYPRDKRTYACVLNLGRTSAHQFEQLNSPDSVNAFFTENFPALSPALVEHFSDAKNHTFFTCPPSVVSAVWCNRYHYGENVVLIGDSAHAIFPALGQGVNAGLEDVALFMKQVTSSERFQKALTQYASARVVDGHAIHELSKETYPRMKGLKLTYILKLASVMMKRKLFRSLHKKFPSTFHPYTMDLVTHTTLPYRRVLATKALQDSIFTAICGFALCVLLIIVTRLFKG